MNSYIESAFIVPWISNLSGMRRALNDVYLCLLCVFSFVCDAAAHDTESLSTSYQSILQAREEATLQASAFDKADHMTGNWWGVRDRLFDSGVEVFAFYNSIFNGNVSGGSHPQHSTYVDDAFFGMKFDLEKLFNWRDGLFVISGINRSGVSLTTNYVGSIYSVQQMVGGQQPFLYQVYLQQKLLENKLRLKLGRFGASDDFNTSPLYGYSLNNGINGDIRNVLFDTRFSAYPFAVWAGALFYDPSPDFNVKLGIFQTSKDQFNANDNGLNWSISGSDGYTAIAQIGWSPLFFKDNDNATDDKKSMTALLTEGLPGHYWVGVTYSGWDLYKRFEGGYEDHSYGFYAHADQMVYQETPADGQGLIVFLAAGYYPQTSISIVPFQINLGLNYKGLFPKRNKDRTMLHFIYGDISSAYARSVHTPGHGSAHSEKVLEFAHRFQLTHWGYFQPDIQYVIDPGGTGDIPNAVVIGAQMGVTF